MRPIWLITGAVALVVIVLAGRVVVEGRTELAEAKSAMGRGEVEAAQRHYLLAARWYLPFLDVQEEAVTGLLGIGDTALSRGDGRRATLAYDDARGALYGSAWLFIPHPELLARADEGLARSLALWNESMRKSGQTQVMFTEGEARGRISQAGGGANPWGMLLMGLGFLGYLVCLGVVAWRWHEAEAGRTGRRGWLLGAAVGMVLWIAGMFLA